jgi:hypothetical protein
MQPAASTPTPKKNWKPVLKAPRHFGGAISDRYSGAAFSIATCHRYTIDDNNSNNLFF